jgi:hypothetical protein
VVTVPFGTVDQRIECILKVLKVQANRQSIIRPDSNSAPRCALFGAGQIPAAA